MPELTDLQKELLRVLKDGSEQGLFAGHCKMKNFQIMKSMNQKPSDEAYITRIIGALKKKGKLKSEIKQGKKGLERIITLL